MSKTQVMKLSTSKDNVEAFFNKMKNKLTEAQAKGDKLDNFDITMIVKHQSKNSFKENQRDKIQQKDTTMKSILSQNDPNVQETPQKSKNKNLKIYNQQMQIESLIIPSQISLKRDLSSGQVDIQNQGGSSPNQHLRPSEKLPSIASIFHFQKRSDKNVPGSSEAKSKKPKFSQQVIEQYRKVQEDYFEEKGSNEDESSSSQEQQKNEQKLIRTISRKHIDIFPNIEISQAVSAHFLSLKNTDSSKKNNPIHGRRCSITDENLLSPKSRNHLEQEIKKQSAKNIVEVVKCKLKEKSLKKMLKISDFIQESKTTEKGENLQRGIQEDHVSRTQVEAQEFDCSEVEEQAKRLSIHRTVGNNVAGQRVSALAKKSIFDQQKNQHSKSKISSINGLENPSSSQKTRSNVQIQLQPIKISSSQTQSSSESSDSKSSASSNEQPQDSVYVIENKLNDCIKLIEKNELSSLEDFLYEFKDKYFFVSNARIQIKWRLLMAHCKQNKKEFERAAINYNNVIELAKENPKSLVIEPAEVYHRLGVCYSEIGWWNKGILAFSEALNRYKKCKNAVKYSECMNNLGTLYLQASSINLAEKCFIQAYNLKKGLYGKNNTKLLTSLFNIFECNLLTKNYDQAQKVISVIEEEIISQIPQTEPNKVLYFSGLYRRRGKMEYLRGDAHQAEAYYLQTFDKLALKYPYCMEFGELMSCLGLLKLENMMYKEAKQYYDKAIMLMNFYCSKDSKTILTLKKNLEYSDKMIKEEKEGRSSKRSTN